MCVILEFPVTEAAARRGHPLLSGGPSVVIFPGVRMERREFTEAEIRRLSHLPAKPRKRARRHPLAKTKD